MKIIILLGLVISCQNKETVVCERWRVIDGKNVCVVGTVTWPTVEMPKFMKEIRDQRENPIMYK